MIPQASIQAWREHAPWPNPAQVEQDLIICRALCDLFNAPALAGKIAFRGGTAIHKLLFKQPLRYSEDIDLVQTQAEPIGPTVDAIRDSLKSNLSGMGSGLNPETSRQTVLGSHWLGCASRQAVSFQRRCRQLWIGCGRLSILISSCICFTSPVYVADSLILRCACSMQS